MAPSSLSSVEQGRAFRTGLSELAWQWRVGIAFFRILQRQMSWLRKMCPCFLDMRLVADSLDLLRTADNKGGSIQLGAASRILPVRRTVRCKLPPHYASKLVNRRLQRLGWSCWRVAMMAPGTSGESLWRWRRATIVSFLGISQILQ